MSKGNYLQAKFSEVIQYQQVRHEISRSKLARDSGLSRDTILNLLDGKKDGSLSSWALMLEAAGVEVVFRVKRPRRD